MLTDSLYLVHYCHPNCKPFQNIMRLPREEAFSLAEKLAKENPDTTAFYRFVDFAEYYPRRLQADEFLYNNFSRLGGRPKEKHPLSFVLQGCDYLYNWFGNEISYKIKLSEVCPDSISFTLGDSCAQYERIGTVRLLTEEQLLAQINDFEGGAAGFIEHISKQYSYIEAQLWEDTAVLQNKFFVDTAPKRGKGLK